MKTKRNGKIAAVCAVLLLALLLTVSPVTALAESTEAAEAAQAEAQNSSYFSGGDGSVTNPYLISNEIELTHIRNVGYYDSDGEYCIDKCFKLIADIYIDLYNPWTPIQGRFTGRFDGNVHGIHNLKINADSFRYAGLFERMENAVVKNLSMGEFTISSNSVTTEYVGAVAGMAVNSTIAYCAFSGEISVAALGAYCGGVVGYMSQGSVLNCTNYSGVKGCGYVGGIVGYAADNSLIDSCTNCWHITYMFNRQSGCAGGIAGKIENGSTINLCVTTERASIIYGGVYASRFGDKIQPCMAQIVGFSSNASIAACTLNGSAVFDGLNDNQRKYCKDQIWGKRV